MPVRRLVVVADDFGHSAHVNEAIVESFERGIVREASLSLMLRASNSCGGTITRHWGRAVIQGSPFERFRSSRYSLGRLVRPLSSRTWS